MKNNSYEVSYSFFFLCFCSFESWFDITSITETAEDIIAKEREQNILHMLHQVLSYSLCWFFRGLFLTLTIIMKRVKILFVELNSGPEAFIVALLDFLRLVGFFFFNFYSTYIVPFSIYNSLIMTHFYSWN